MMNDLVTLNEASERIGVPVNVVMSWCDQFIPGYSDRDPFGRRRVTRRQLEALQLICSLRAQRLGDNVIANRIQPMLDTQRTIGSPSWVS